MNNEKVAANSLWLFFHVRILKYISLSPELTKFHLAERHQH